MNYKLVSFLVIIIIEISRLDAQIAVVVHPDVASDSISSDQLRDIYTGDMTFWPDGEAIVVCDLNDEEGVHDNFYDFIGISSSRVKSIWMKRMLSGQSDPPLLFLSGRNLSQRIAETPSTIGFIDAKEVTSNLKVLMIIQTRED